MLDAPDSQDGVRPLLNLTVAEDHCIKIGDARVSARLTRDGRVEFVIDAPREVRIDRLNDPVVQRDWQARRSPGKGGQ